MHITLQQITAAIDAKVAATKPLDGYVLDKDGRLKPTKKRQSVSQRIRDRKKPKQKLTRAIKGAQKP